MIDLSHLPAPIQEAFSALRNPGGWGCRRRGTLTAAPPALVPEELLEPLFGTIDVDVVAYLGGEETARRFLAWAAVNGRSHLTTIVLLGIIGGPFCVDALVGMALKPPSNTGYTDEVWRRQVMSVLYGLALLNSEEAAEAISPAMDREAIGRWEAGTSVLHRHPLGVALRRLEELSVKEPSAMDVRDTIITFAEEELTR